MRENYYNEKSPSYGMGHTRLRRILDLVGNRPGLRVLDVGCGNGRMGQKVKERGNYVAGVEISSIAAEMARKVLDTAYAFDIEKPWPAEVQQGDFDLVLLPEILEHVFDPAVVLTSAYKALKSDGSVIITTPNFMTWTNRLRFIIGAFRYQEQGMFDFGHIRWFTYAYLKEVLARTSFALMNERHIIFPGKLTRILKYFPSVFAFQFIVKARKLS
jgi:2-polyprenyl-3-methyl-5-hydroxy-6-metoxy-1,4-benzoquinol methylase